MNTAIVGFGGAGKGHFERLHKVRGIKVKGAFDVDKEAVKEIQDRSIKPYRNFDEVISDNQVDAVLITSVSSLHGKQAVEALKAGKHVMVEKPMATSLKDSKKMVEIAKRKKLLLTVLHNRRFDPDVLAVKDVLDRGLLGEIIHFRNIMFSGKFGREEKGWRRSARLGGGLFFDWAPHLVDQALYIAGSRVSNVSGVKKKITPYGGKQAVDNYFLIFLNFRNGIMAETGFSRVSLHPLPKLYIQGEKGTITAESWKTGTALARYVKNGEIVEKEIDGKKKSRIMKEKLFRNFYNAFKGEEELLISPESALEVMKVMDSVKQA